MAQILLAIFLLTAGTLLAINVFLIIARLTHHDHAARTVARAVSRYTWVFKLGGADPDHTQS